MGHINRIHKKVMTVVDEAVVSHAVLYKVWEDFPFQDALVVGISEKNKGV